VQLKRQKEAKIKLENLTRSPNLTLMSLTFAFDLLTSTIDHLIPTVSWIACAAICSRTS